MYARVYVSMLTVSEIRNQFPALSRKVYGKDLVYLDNAATSQRPQMVLDKWLEISAYSNANIHRAVHRLADEATQAYEQARDSVREYLNAAEREEIVFTSGTTAAINLVAFSFGEAFVNEGDEVIVTEADHHSNIVPWQLMCQRKKAVLKVLPVDENGYLMVEKMDDLLTSRTKILAVTHISNVLGIINPIEDIISKCHSKGVPVLVDGAQGIVHCPVDVQKLDCDFYVFSGHKIYAATGTGILYGRRELLEAMPPYMGGGDMVDTVSFAKTTYAELPLKFEAGTPHFIGQATLKPALEFAKWLKEGEIGKAVKEEEEKIIEYMTNALAQIEGCTMYGTAENKIPLFSFNVEGCFPSDLAQLLDKMGVAVRTGFMCCEPLMTRFGVTSMVRASFLPYNTLQEAEYFIKCLNRAVNMLR